MAGFYRMRGVIDGEPEIRAHRSEVARVSDTAGGLLEAGAGILQGRGLEGGEIVLAAFLRRGHDERRGRILRVPPGVARRLKCGLKIRPVRAIQITIFEKPLAAVVSLDGVR